MQNTPNPPQDSQILPLSPITGAMSRLQRRRELLGNGTINTDNFRQTGMWAKGWSEAVKAVKARKQNKKPRRSR